MEITRREVVASISIIAIMLIVGILISNKISRSIIDTNEKYNKAIRVEDEDIFRYGMKTSVGDAFVYGDLNVLDPVTYPEIDGAYSYVEKVKERYTMHTRTKTYTVNGKTKTKTETYWTWDVVGRENIRSKQCEFLGVNFNFDKFNNLNDSHITTIKESSHVRYKYYGSPIKATGTIFTTLNNNDISDKNYIYEDKDIDQTHEYLESNFPLTLFWVIWILLIFGAVYGFYYLDNNWLNI